MAELQAKSFWQQVRPLGAWLLGGIVLSPGLAVLLAWITTGYVSTEGWASYLGVVSLAGGLLALGWWLIKSESPPRWLGMLLIGAAILRLAVGVLWYTALPVLGYGSPAEQAGYVMADAYERDQTAWDLANSQKPLRRAFQGAYRKADQYGGMLFLSAWVYRFFGGDVHQPLLLVVITAASSALVLPFTWAFLRRAFGVEAAKIGAWVLALYPEAVLMGSSQLREAFTMTLAAAAFYGFIQLRARPSLRVGPPWKSMGWILGALLLSLPFSPPFAALLLLSLVIQALFMGRDFWRTQVWRQWRLWLLLFVLVALVVAGVWVGWSQLAPEGITNPLALVGWWLRKSAGWQAHLSERASGWVQKIFASTPEWMHAPLLLVYGVAQPFLPAALGDVTGAPIWRGIAIWRALGWTLLLPFLVYAPLRALYEARAGSGFSARGLSLVVWLGILIASFRGGGDQWDNPRYRAAFVSLQAALTAWVLYRPRLMAEMGLKRVLVSTVIILAWFLPWYFRRYIYLNWPVIDLFKTLGLGLASAGLYLLWDWARQA